MESVCVRVGVEGGGREEERGEERRKEEVESRRGRWKVKRREIENKEGKGERGGSNSAISDVTGKTGKQKLSLLISLIPVCGMQLLYRL